MSLIDGYGVLVGTLHSYECDSGRSDTEYYHCNILVRAGSAIFRCAVDLDSKKQKDGLQWRVLRISRSDLEAVVDLSPGWHMLVSERGGGALDYLRSPILRSTQECIHVRERTEPGVADPAEGCFPWFYGSSLEAFRDLEPVLKSAVKLFVFGEPFRIGKGVHNIHQNQGDPVGSRWSLENGIWQDGAVAGLTASGEILMFISRFRTQATKTDSRGKPSVS